MRDDGVDVSGEGCLVAEAGQAVAAARELCEHQPGPVPGHLRVVPFYPGKAVAFGVPGRLHIEIGSGDQSLRPMVSFGVDNGQTIAAFIAVYIDQMSAIR